MSCIHKSNLPDAVLQFCTKKLNNEILLVIIIHFMISYVEFLMYINMYACMIQYAIVI